MHDHRFLRVWLVGAAVNVIRWLEMLAVGVYVFDQTGSPLQVALFTLLRMLPLGLFGVFGGMLGDRGHRLRNFLIGIGGMCVVSLTLAALLLFGELTLWQLALGTFLNGVFWVTDFSIRRTLMADVAGIARMGRALALDIVTANGSRMLGPVLGGALLQLIGLGGAYVLGTVLYLGSFIALLAPGIDNARRAPADTSIWQEIADGFRYVAGHRLLTSVMLVTVIFNLWGFPMLSMVPVIGRDELQLSALAIGLLMSAEGAGALIGATSIAFVVRTGYYRRLYLTGISAFLVAAFVFPFLEWPPLAGMALLMAGLGTAAFASMQSTLVLIHTPRQNRGKTMGMLTMCIGTAPLGLLHLGWLADQIGTREAIVVIAVEGMVALALVCCYWPEIMRPERAARMSGGDDAGG